MSASARWRPRRTDLTALLVVVLIAAVGLAAVSRLPTEIVVGWHYGLDGRVRVTRAPRVVGLALMPALAAGFLLALRVGARVVPDGSTEFGPPVAVVYEAFAHLLLALLCAVQAYLVWVNL